MKLIDVLKENAPLVIVSIFALMIYLANSLTFEGGHTTHDIDAFHPEFATLPSDDEVVPDEGHIPVPIQSFEQEVPENNQGAVEPDVVEQPVVEQQQQSPSVQGDGHETLEDIDIEHYHNSAAYMERLSEFLDDDYKEFVAERGGGSSSLIQWLPTPEAVAALKSSEDRKIPRYTNPRNRKAISWEYLSAGGLTPLLKQYEKKLQDFYNSLDPTRQASSRDQLVEYVAAIRGLLAYQKPAIAPEDVAFLLEEIDMQTSRNLRHDRIDRALYQQWLDIDLYNLIGSKVSHRYKEQLMPPFQLRVRLLDVRFLRPAGNTNGVNSNVLRLTFTMAVLGKNFKDIAAVNPRGNRRARGAIQKERGGYREVVFSNVNAQAYDITIRATDGSQQKVRYDFSGYTGTTGYRKVTDGKSNWLYYKMSRGTAEQQFRKGYVP